MTIDVFFAENAIKDYYEKVKSAEKNGKKPPLLNEDEAEAVISLLTKRREEYLELFLNNFDEKCNRSMMLKALFLARIFIKDITLTKLSREEAVKMLKSMKSHHAKKVLKELDNKF
ncbi:MAG: bifunctional aconitate hydratase 2/2-methylisocitrate dehydratase [Alphaproteobacteria bacterium ADurb.Bin438]|nr:MAG: bifunctional aconitate hydratase 2/2-methylisocitrate dehydratase [Alphaproteobacteria bacterium ADurb.Bin438]